MATDDRLLEKVHDLSDLELAVLLCLISREHCLISTPAGAIADLVSELQLVAGKTFGLEAAVINCSPTTTLEDFASALLSKNQPSGTNSSPPRAEPSYFSSNPKSPASQTSSPGPHIANFVIARNLDLAPHAIQIQALELLRTRRIFTRTAVQVAPKQFVFVPVLESDSGGQAHVTPHLNDYFAIAHWHDPDEGFVNLEEVEDEYGDDAASTASVVKAARSGKMEALISEDDITSLREQAQQVQVDVDVTRYQMNIVSFLRMHRAVDKGITPSATRHFAQLMRNLAPLHKIDYVTPALVALAARKVYLHRILITEPEKERSMQWGSNLESVRNLLQGVGPEEVIDEVLNMVTAPV
ncbi:hypothetical protein K4F52_000800 [Lecanicillium sp. MT-2017a]|nr:hypothetical protein K4F52_000800 [Lecanicillium sp. MT-2017a]